MVSREGVFQARSLPGDHTATHLLVQLPALEVLSSYCKLSPPIQHLRKVSWISRLVLRLSGSHSLGLVEEKWGSISRKGILVANEHGAPGLKSIERELGSPGVYGDHGN